MRTDIKNQYIQSIYNQYMGKRDEARADLEVLLDEAVGVGDHTHIGEAIKGKIEEIDRWQSLVSTMNQIFPAPDSQQEAP